MRIVTEKTGWLDLGKERENLATRVELTIGDLRICDGRPVLVHQRATDKAPYPVPITQDGDIVVWDVTTSDTYVPGIGRAELRWVGVNGEVVKSRIYGTMVARSLAEPVEPPDVYSGYLSEMAESAARAEAAAAIAVDNAIDTATCFELMAECGLAEPMTDGENIYTDENGAIYIL